MKYTPKIWAIDEVPHQSSTAKKKKKKKTSSLRAWSPLNLLTKIRFVSLRESFPLSSRQIRAAKPSRLGVRTVSKKKKEDFFIMYIIHCCRRGILYCNHFVSSSILTTPLLRIMRFISTPSKPYNVLP